MRPKVTRACYPVLIPKRRYDRLFPVRAVLLLQNFWPGGAAEAPPGVNLKGVVNGGDWPVI